MRPPDNASVPAADQHRHAAPLRGTSVAQVPEAIGRAGGRPRAQVIPRCQTQRERLIQAEPGVPLKPLLVGERLVPVGGEDDLWFCWRRRRLAAEALVQGGQPERLALLAALQGANRYCCF